MDLGDLQKLWKAGLRCRKVGTLAGMESNQSIKASKMRLLEGSSKVSNVIRNPKFAEEQV